MSFAERRFGICTATLLAIMGVAQFAAALLDSATMDEGYHLLCGYNFLRTGIVHAGSEHPPLAQAISAVPLLFLNLRARPFPRVEEEQWRAAREFMYGNRYPA